MAPCIANVPATGVLQDYDDNRNLFLPWPPPGTFNEVANNPSVGGLNTSARVAHYVRPGTETYRIIRYRACANNPLDLSAGKTIISMLVYSSRAGVPVVISLKNSADGDPDEVAVATVTTTRVNTWERLYFDFTSIQGNTNVRAIDLFFDPEAAHVATVASRTYYLDDIRYESGLPCTTQIPATGYLINYDEHRYVNLAYIPTGTWNEFLANPQVNAVNNSATVAQYVRPALSTGNLIRYQACGTHFDLSPGRTVFSLMVRSPNAGTEVVLSLKAADGLTEIAQAYALMTLTNSWEELIFDLSSVRNATNAAYLDIILDPNNNNVATAAQRTYLIDNLKYSFLPEINVRTGTTNILTGGTYAFGALALGSSSPEVSFVIENNGVEDLILSGTPIVAITGDHASDFVINQTTTSSTVGSVSSTSFTVIFTPSGSGVRTANLAIANNDSDENPYYITLTGSGAGPEINVRVGATNILTGGTRAFGNQNVGTSSTAVTFTIENLGNSVLNLNGTPRIAISGTNAAEFTINQATTTATVAAGASTTFTVTFSPTSAGAKTAAISIANNDADENPYVINLTGTGQAPEINVRVGATNIATAGTHAFGNQVVGASSTAVTFTIENLGNSVLNLSGTPRIAISGTNAAEFTINQTTTTATVAAGASTTFTVTFTPTSAGAKTAALSIANNDADENPYVINLTGTGQAPEINVRVGATNIATAGTHAFGDQNVGTNSSVVTFTIENTGNGLLNLTGTPRIAISGANAAEFTVNQTTTTATVAAGASTTFTVVFSPATAGAKTAALSIANNDADENPYVINLSGTGRAPEINITVAGANVLHNGTHNFGTFTIGTSSTVTTFTIENLGNQNLNLTGNPKIVKSGTGAADFTINESATLAMVAGGASTTFTVTFTPSATGARTASISIANNDADENPYVINLTGTGSSVAVPNISVSSGATAIPSSGSYSFGSISHGTSSSAVSFTISNSGTANLTISGISLAGANSGDFNLNQGSTSTTIAAGASTTFTVAFTPSAVGSRTASVTITSNDANANPYTFSLTGTGTAPEINIQAAGTNVVSNGNYSFGTFNVASSSSAVTFTIENLGNQVLNLTNSPIVAISGVAAADFAINQAATSSAIAAGGSTSFTVTFTPSVEGVRNAIISIANNDADENPYIINLSGTGSPVSSGAQVSVQAGGNAVGNNGTINMGSATVGATGTPITVSITNSGTSALPLTASEVYLTGGNSSDFTIDLSGVSSPLAPGATASFTVVFAPGSTGSRNTSLVIALDGADDFNATLTGVGLSSEVGSQISLSAGGNSVEHNGTINVGSVNVGQTGAPVSFTVVNTGSTNVALTASDVVISGADASDYILDLSTVSSPLAPGESATFTVVFAPSAGGIRNAVISVSLDGAEPFTANLSGTAIPSTSVLAASLSASVNVYPNPSNGDFMISFSKSLSGRVQVTITNQLGVAVKTLESDGINAGTEMSVSLGDNAAGIYIVVIKTTEGNHVMRVVKI
ncbi:MAG: beta strand repeat-containing protein [Cytophagaceae bacterium]